MRVCVTDGAGFVGRALASRLLGRGLEVRVLAGASQRVETLRASGADVVIAELADRESLERAVDGAGVVYHAAAICQGSSNTRGLFATDVAGTQNLFEACIRKGVPHIVYLSSIAIYGLTENREYIDEDTAYDRHFSERNNRARSEIEADQYAAAIGSKTNLAVTIIRSGIVYGRGKPLPIAPLGFFAGRANVVFGRSKQHFPLTYLENLVDAMELVAQRTGPGLRKYIVVDDDDLTLGKYHAARKEVEGTRTIFLPAWPILLAAIGLEIFMWLVPFGFGALNRWRQIKRLMQDRRFSTRRIRTETSWSPRISLKDAIRRSLSQSSA